LLVACGNDKKSSGGNNNTLVCPAGYVIINNQCVFGNGVPTNTSGVFYDYNYTDNAYGTGSLTIRDAAAYKEFLKNAMGVCDRTNYSGGTASCDAWIGGSLRIALSTTSATNSNTATLQFTAWPTPQYWSGYFGFDTQGAVRNPLAINARVSVINNYQGFQVDGYGDYYTSANRSLITLMVRTGKLTDNAISYEVYFPVANQQKLMATGTLRRF
ncbi:MAG: hypothetical protein ACLGGX_10630, partial [Bdellovibrionia bacterium]